MKLLGFTKKIDNRHFFREPIARPGRFPFEQRSSPPRSAARQYWPGPHSLPPLERGPGPFAFHYDKKVKKDDELSRHHPGIDGKPSGRWLQYRKGRRSGYHVEIGRGPVLHTVNNAPLVCRFLLA